MFDTYEIYSHKFSEIKDFIFTLKLVLTNQITRNSIFEKRINQILSVMFFLTELKQSQLVSYSISFIKISSVTNFKIPKTLSHHCVAQYEFDYNIADERYSFTFVTLYV